VKGGCPLGGGFQLTGKGQPRLVMHRSVSVCEGGVSISASTAIQYAWASEGDARLALLVQEIDRLIGCDKAGVNVVLP
jgi:hypothetical protein